ncbi:amidohydrolase [Caulobacter sp. S45]|uniref:amidohydrolase n=1 Tax=Caulobacter sp. S45 TaxID=1641861 RepID=UPI00131CC566|nr:amidohydrolase [Caulobacter sp. S45]
MRTGIRRAALAGVAALATISAGAAGALDIPATKAAIDQGLDRQYPHLDALYKDIHKHPELGFLEVRTAKTLAAEMRALGFEVTEGVGKTGLVAIYHNGPGPTVMVRTELDALPLPEKTGLPYASTATQLWKGVETPVAHACGHDIHMAVWVGTAKTLVDLKARWSGTLMFIAQPAEELASGAKAMVDDGLFTRFRKPDYGFALHVGTDPVGDVAYRSGVMSSNSDELDVLFTGRGGHGAKPHITIDPVMMAGRFIVDVQSVISREKDPSAFGVITIGSVQAGNAGNVIPDTALLRGTIRSFDPEVRTKLLDGISRTARAEAMMAGAPEPKVTFGAGGKAVVNDAALSDRSIGVLKAAFGAKAEAMEQPNFASEDYSEYIIAGVPSFFFRLGGIDPGVLAKAEAAHTSVPGNHSPYFAPVPEPAIRTGVEAMSLLVMSTLQPAASGQVGVVAAQRSGE